MCVCVYDIRWLTVIHNLPAFVCVYICVKFTSGNLLSNIYPLFIFEVKDKCTLNQSLMNFVLILYNLQIIFWI